MAEATKKQQRFLSLSQGKEEELSRKDIISSLGLTDADTDLLTLNDREITFCAEMIANNLNTGKAYMQAFGVPMSREEQKKMRALMQRQDIKRVLRASVQKKIASTLDNLDAQLLEVYCQRAFYDISDFHTPEGAVRPLDEIPEEARCVIDAIETKFYGKDGDVRSVNYKLADRDRALKTLRDFIAGLRPDEETELTQLHSEEENEEAARYAGMSDEELRKELAKLG